MEEELAEVKVKAVLPALPAIQGYAIFLSSERKTFVIYVTPDQGETIAGAICKKKYERPLTHDLVKNILLGLEATIERAVINDVDKKAFFARLFLKMQNEIGTKLIEIDTRPSDAIILALQMNRPIYVTDNVLEKVEDMTKALNNIIDDTTQS